MTDFAYDLFVSYADADCDWVEGYLFDCLTEAGVTYHSEAAFTLGAPRIAEFERAVKQSRRTLLILSPAYLVDGSSQFIDLLAQTHGLESSAWPVIPLTLHPTTLPPRLGMLAGLDATNPDEWDAVVERLCAEFKRPVPAESLKPECPYPGMRAFEESDKHRFFGRDAEIDEIKNQLRLHPFITVIGPSGSGKSSLVFAGLIPALRGTQLFGKGDWIVRRMRPGATPSSELDELLVGTSLDPKPDDAARNGERLLLIVDQFEEVFTISGDEGPPFQDRLLGVIGKPDTYVILTVRADFYPELMTSPLWPQMRAHRQEVLPLGQDGLRQAILKPAEEVGVFVESTLVERLVSDAFGEPGILPFVQETLRLLWDHVERRFLSVHAYEALVLPRKAYGGTDQRRVTGLQVAIARHADVAFNDLDERRQNIARRIFLRLVQFGEGRADTRRQQSVEDLRAAGDDQAVFMETVRHLAQRRLLTLAGEDTDPEAKVDIAHEALISGWQTLQKWISERRGSELSRRRLESKAEEWIRFGKGAGGLLDEAELAEADRYLNSADALELGVNDSVRELIDKSWAAIHSAREKEQEALQRELDLEVKARKAAQSRNRVAVTLLLVSTGLMIGALIATYFAYTNAQEVKRQSVLNLARASQFYLESNQALESLVAALTSAQRLKEVNWGASDARIEPVIALNQAFYMGREVNRFKGHQAGITSLSLNKDGSLIASASNDSTIKLWRPDGTLLRTLKGHTAAVNEVEFSPDGQTIASTGYDGTIRVWDIEGKERKIIDVASATMPPREPGISWDVSAKIISSVTFSPDGKRIAAASSDKTVTLWNVDDGALLKTLSGHEGKVVEVTFIPNHDLLVSADTNGLVIIWNAEGVEQRRIKTENVVYGIAVSPDGNSLATADKDGSITLWALDGRKIDGNNLHERAAINVRFSHDGKRVVSGGEDGTIVIFNILDYSKQILRGHQGIVGAVRFSPDDRTVVSGGEDGTIRVWSSNTDQTILKHDGAINNAKISPDGSMVATAADDGIKLWDRNGQFLRPLTGHEKEVMSIGFSPDSKTIVSGGADKTVRIWNLNGEGVKTKSDHGNVVRSVSFSRDGQTIGSGSADKTIKLWNLNGELLQTIDNGAEVNGISFAPDGTVASAGSDNKIRIWTAKGTLLQTLDGHTDAVLTVCFSPDGNLLASGASDSTVRLWRRDGNNFTTFAVLQGHSFSVYSVAFNPVDQVLGTAGGDGKIKFWNLNGQLLQTLPAYEEMVSDISFSPDGKLLASASYNHQAILWNLDLDDLMVRGCSRLKDYLATNSGLSEQDRQVCANVKGR